MDHEKKPMYAGFLSEQEYHEKLGQIEKKDPGLTLKIGDLLPEVSLMNHKGEKVNLFEIAKGKNVVLFFYPGNKEGLRYPELMGCTPQACNFRDAMSQFEKNNTIVYGISFQTKSRQEAFVKREKLNFDILNDTQKKLALALGIPIWTSKSGEEFPVRQTYIISKGGALSKIYSNIQSDDIQDHIPEVLTYIEQLTQKTNRFTDLFTK